MEPLSILLFFLLFALSAFFSWSEIALISLPAHKVEALNKKWKHGAKILKKLKANNERLLITILIWNNLVNVITASLATKISIDIASASGLDQTLMIGIATWVITLLILFFGEIFPKTFATRHAEKISLSVAKIYEILQYVLFPIVISTEFLMKKLQKTEQKISMSEEEIHSFMEMGKNAGAILEDEYEKIKNMIKYYEITAEEIMTPRIKIDWIKASLTVKDALDKVLEFSHSRIPVFNESIDDVEYVVTLRELLEASHSGKSDRKLSTLSLSKIIKIPLTKPIHKTLELFRKHRKHISIVMDEYGGVAGLLSLEDIVEEVFGDFMDETDKEDDPIKKFNDWFYVQSFVRFDEILDKFKIDFKDVNISEEEFEWETISYFITSHLERFPKTGEEILLSINNPELKIKKLSIKILDIDKNTIWKVFVKLNK